MKNLLENDIDKNIFYALECGLPITKKPFAVIGDSIGINESEVLSRYNYFLSKKLVRRFGAIFDSIRFGYSSTLCAVKVNLEDLDKVKIYFNSIPGITHCYLRTHPINLWFTFSAHKPEFNDRLDKIKSFFSPEKILCLTALNRYKISVIFDTGSKNKLIHLPTQKLKFSGNIIHPSDIEKQLVKKLWSVPAIQNPYETIAEDLNLDINKVLQILQNWKEKGVLKRIALIPYHYKLGYKSNIMCVWKVDSERINYIGNELSKLSEITHCYERHISPKFNYNLYAMVHGNNYEQTINTFNKISKDFSIDNGLTLLSTKEIKKTSLRLFQ